MGFLRKIKDALSPGSRRAGGRAREIRDPAGIYLYVKCHRCGAPVRVRVDRSHDLQSDYDTGGYVLHKEIMDGTCFALMQTTVHFDGGYNITDQEIEGGAFITWDEYAALTQPKPSEPDA